MAGLKTIDPWARTEPLTDVPDDELDDEHRYGIYILEGGEPHRECTTSLRGIGTAIVQLAEDRREAGLPPAVFGVKDRVERRWEATLWHPTKEGT